MVIKIDNSTVSDKSWGDVDKSAIWARLKKAIADGEPGAAQAVKEVYAAVKAQNNADLTESDLFGPHHEIVNDTVILNKAGVIAAAQAIAGARSKPSLTSQQLAQAKAHLRKHYKALKMTIPASLESVMLQEVMPAPSVKIEANTQNGRRKISIQGAMKADVETANGRVYPAGLLRAEANRIQTAIDSGESFGGLDGEIEHPGTGAKASGTWRASLLETVVRWNKITFNEATQSIDLVGEIANTQKGRDLVELYDMGVAFAASQRAYAESEYRIVGDRELEFITALEIVGYDLVKEPAVVGQQVKIESVKIESKEDNMELTLESLREKHPELYKALVESIRKEELTKIESAKKAEQEAAIRKALGLGEKDDIVEAITKIAEDKKTADEARAAEEAKAVEKTIDEATKELKYDEDLNKQFVESVKSAKPKTVEEAKELIESKKKEYDGIIAKARLEAKGYGIKVKGSVFERETGVPEYAKKSYEMSESIARRGLLLNRVPDKKLMESHAGRMTVELLEMFDKQNQQKLIAESKLALEAEQTTDLNLPYLVARTIIREAMPQLVALNVFDVSTTDQAPSKIFFEKYAHEAGVEASIVSEVVVMTADGLPVSLAHKNIKKGTVVVKSADDLTTYVEGTDYIIEYGFGEIYRLAAAAFANNATLHVSYTYAKVREGEMAAIQRGKQTLSSQDLAIAADRLATQISSEAVAFAQSQLGEDAQARALAGVIRQIQTYVDRRLFSMAVFAARQVANNSGGSWSQSGAPAGVTFDKWLVELERKIGIAKTKVVNRYYEPNAIVMSTTNADMMANSERFKAAGQTPGFDLTAAGYVGNIKGLPVFASTEFGDDIILVTNRELVQHRIFKALILKGPYPTYDASGELVAADQYYVEEFNGTATPVKEKGSYVLVTA